MVAEPRCQAIVIDVDIPGGTTAGVRELADLVHTRPRKPVYAIATVWRQRCFWIGSQVGKGHFLATPGAEVGRSACFGCMKTSAACWRKRA